jgi:hypothetical protein
VARVESLKAQVKLLRIMLTSKSGLEVTNPGYDKLYLLHIDSNDVIDVEEVKVRR